MEATRERILDATHRLFAAHGFRGATTRLIAAEAGVNEVTLFRQFACKEELLAAAIEYGAERGIESLAAHALPPTPADVRAELQVFLTATLQGFIGARQAVRVSMAEWGQHPTLQEPLLRTANHVFSELRAYVKAAQVAGLLRSDLGVTVMTQAILGVILADGLLRDMMPARFPLRPAASVSAYLEIVLEGLVPSGREGTGE